MAGFDAVFVGSGVNSLAGGALLAKEGWRVCVLERNDWLGGAIKTVDGLTAPGFTHEVFSSWHPLWVGSPAYAELKPELDALGLEYLNTDLPTAAAFPDGSSAFLSTDGDANVAELGEAWQRQFDQFMAGAEIAFGVLGTELWSGAGLLVRPQGVPALRPPRPGRVRRTHIALGTGLADRHVRERARPRPAGAMGAAHGTRTRSGGVGVHDAGDRLRAAARRHAGAEGWRRQARRGSGDHHPQRGRRAADRDGRRADRRLRGSRDRRPARDGESIAASRAVLACVTPTQLYGRLLGESDAPKHVRDAALRFRYGRGEMQIHIAMNELPRWKGDDRLARTPLLHLTPGLDGVSRAVNEADRGLLPAEATIALGQPMTLDPTRAPEGSWVIWVQLQELPQRLKGDAAGELDTSAGVDRGAARGVCRPDRRADRPPHREPRVRDRRSGRHVAGRHGGREPELGRRRHLRGVVRARPEPPLPSHPSLTWARNAGRRPLAHRGEHPPRSRPRGGLRLHRREAPHAAAASPRRLLAKLPGVP